MTAEQQEILEGNKLITEFEGKSVYPVEGTKEYKKWKGERCEFHHFELKYHSSWDWLIPAHNKARELFMQLDKPIQKEFLESDSAYVERFGFVNFFATFENQYHIMSSWRKMVDFAKWYNQQTTNV